MDRFHAAFAVQASMLEGWELKHYGAEPQSAALACLTNQASSFLTRWACIALLGSYEERLNRVRDYSGNQAINQPPAKLLHDLRTVLLDSVDRYNLP